TADRISGLPFAGCSRAAGDLLSRAEERHGGRGQGSEAALRDAFRGTEIGGLREGAAASTGAGDGGGGGGSRGRVTGAGVEDAGAGGVGEAGRPERSVHVGRCTRPVVQPGKPAADGGAAEGCR